MVYAHALVKHKAFSLPKRRLRGNGLKVLQNAAIELKHLLKTELLHIRCKLLAADAAGAKHRNTLVPLGIELPSNVVWQLAELRRARINGLFERAGLILV